VQCEVGKPVETGFGDFVPFAVHLKLDLGVVIAAPIFKQLWFSTQSSEISQSGAKRSAMLVSYAVGYRSLEGRNDCCCTPP
jgi:hypothetical protein